MQFIPYLNFNGNCREAFTFYEKVFKGQIAMISTFGEMPGADQMPMPEAAKNGVMHVRLQVGTQVLMGSDAMPGADEGCQGGYTKPQGLFVSINLGSADEGRRVFGALSEGGTVAMPFEATFWSPGFGMVTDRFGTPWMVNVEAPQG